MSKSKSVKQPLFHVIKRGNVSTARQVAVRVVAVVFAFMLGCIITWASTGFSKNPLMFFAYLWQGNFNPASRIWELLKNTALLYAVCLALIPAFRMKFWNLGGNGQILVGGLFTIYCMVYLGGKIPDAVLWIVMLLGSVAIGAVWAVIPAIFKAKFKTNESLFTLMMNYIASGLVAYSIKFIGGRSTTGTIGIVRTGALPELGNDAVLSLIVVTVLAVVVTVYMRKSKHGYEIAVVGDSENTARYVGINVKKVIIRTLVLSGAICGLVGLLLTASINHTVVTDETMSLGHGFTAFTAIIAVWIAHNDPVASLGVSFGIIFVTNGMVRVRTMFGITDESISNMIVGLIYLIIIACEFFINYEVKFNKKTSANVKEVKA